MKGLMSKRFSRFWQIIAAVLAWMALTPLVSQAQTWGSWAVGTLQVPGGARKWGGFLEGQIRMNGVARQYNYHEYKGGISYDLSQNFTVLLGLGRYITYDHRDLQEPLIREIRVWQQLTQSQNLSRLKFEHRYRFEQRFLDHLDGREEYRNRIRYRLNLLIPLNDEKLEAGTVFVSLYDEIFLNNRLPNFERNRFYTGMGYQLTPQWTIQAGWLNQYDASPGPVRTKNNVVVTVLYRLVGVDRLLRLPTSMD